MQNFLNEHKDITLFVFDIFDIINNLLKKGIETLKSLGLWDLVADLYEKYGEIENIAKNVKEIIYMAGDFSNTGNVTQYAEYNAIYDPKALEICLNADFPKQTIVSNEISTTLSVDFCVYDELIKKAEGHETPASKSWINYFEEMYNLGKELKFKTGLSC